MTDFKKQTQKKVQDNTAFELARLIKYPDKKKWLRMLHKKLNSNGKT